MRCILSAVVDALLLFYLKRNLTDGKTITCIEFSTLHHIAISYVLAGVKIIDFADFYATGWRQTTCAENCRDISTP